MLDGPDTWLQFFPGRAKRCATTSFADWRSDAVDQHRRPARIRRPAAGQRRQPCQGWL